MLLEWSKVCLSKQQFVSDSEIGHRTLVSTQKNIQPKFACFCASRQIAEEWFHLKSNEEYSGAGPQSSIGECENGKWQHLCQRCGDSIITLRWQGSTALYSGYRDQNEYCCQGCHHKSQRLKLWFQIWHFIYITESDRLFDVAALLWIYRATFWTQLSMCLFSLLETSSQKPGMFSALSACG